MKNTNYMRDLMLTGFELSRISGGPMLYLGNPGMGKTTIVNLWAKRNGYHVESLIGRAFVRSKYMVDKSDFVVAIFDDSDPHTGGTWHTLDYAIRKGKIVIKIQWRDIR